MSTRATIQTRPGPMKLRRSAPTPVTPARVRSEKGLHLFGFSRPDRQRKVVSLAFRRRGCQHPDADQESVAAFDEPETGAYRKQKSSRGSEGRLRVARSRSHTASPRPCRSRYSLVSSLGLFTRGRRWVRTRV